MSSVQRIKTYLSSLEDTIKAQGDFRIYASKYVEDVKLLLLDLEAAPKEQKVPSPDVIIRKKKDS